MTLFRLCLFIKGTYSPAHLSSSSLCPAAATRASTDLLFLELPAVASGCPPQRSRVPCSLFFAAPVRPAPRTPRVCARPDSSATR